MSVVVIDTFEMIEVNLHKINIIFILRQERFAFSEKGPPIQDACEPVRVREPHQLLLVLANPAQKTIERIGQLTDLIPGQFLNEFLLGQVLRDAAKTLDKESHRMPHHPMEYQAAADQK